jgi:Ion channel
VTRSDNPGLFRNSAVWLLVALGLLFLSAPFVQDLSYGTPIEACLLTLVMVFAVLAVGARGRTLGLALLLVGPALAARWINYARPDLLSPVVYLLAGMLFFAFVVAQILRFILRTPRVDANVLCAALSGYLMLGLLWVPAYALVAQINPGAFVISGDSSARMDGFRAFYFSFITLCTVGYGDVVPASRAAQMLAIVEAIVGLFYVAVLISRLVAIYSSAPPATESETQSGSDGRRA